MTWENKCQKCGLCCHEKVRYGRELVFDLDSWCEFFDPATRSCSVYFERFKKSTRCKPVTKLKAMCATYLPDECAYVKWARARHIRLAFPRRIRFIHSRSDSDSDDSQIFSLA